MRTITKNIETLITIEAMQCSECAAVYGLNSQFLRQARDVGNHRYTWHCPHCFVVQGFSRDTLEKERQEKRRLEIHLQELREGRQYWITRHAEAVKNADSLRRSRDGMKGALKKEQKRVRNGQCPCCDKRFNNLHEHMAQVHPEHGKETNDQMTQ